AAQAAAHSHTLSLHDALPISAPEDGLIEQLMSDRWYRHGQTWLQDPRAVTISVLTTQQSVGARQWMYLHDEQTPVAVCGLFGLRSEEHTSELQSRFDLVCRLR